jgi:acyl carrier protein
MKERLVTKDEILARLQPVFRDVLDDESIVIAPDSKASDVKGWDSVAHIRILIAVEQEFGIQFDTAEINALDNVGDLITLVGKHLGAKV